MEPTTAGTVVFDTDDNPDQSIRLAAMVFGGIAGAGAGLLTTLFAGVRSAEFVFPIACMGLVAGGLIGRQLTAPLRRTGRSRLRYCLLLPGLSFIAGGVAGTFLGFAPVALLSVFVGLIVFALGGAVGMMARTRYVRAVCDNPAPTVSWVAETSRTAKRRRYAMAAGLAVIVVGSIVIDLSRQEGISTYLPFLGSVIGGLLGGGMRSETLHAYEAGIEVERPINRGLIPSDRISGYKLSEAELRIELSYRLDYRCDRTQIDDIDAVVETLDRYIDAA